MRQLFACFLLAAVAACSSDSSDEKGDGDGSTTADSGADAPPYTGPPMELIPTVSGSCPDFVEGTNSFEFGDGLTRNVEIWVSEEAFNVDSPLVFYWHGTGSISGEAIFGLEASTIDAIKAAGGIVASPSRGPAMGATGIFPWYLTVPGPSPNLDDLLLADQILACADEKYGVDLTRIHATGISAGALHVVQMAARRSGYMASIAPISGGKNGEPPVQDPDNPYAAMIIFGGDDDNAFSLNFAKTARDLHASLGDAGHFSFLCDHGNGHPPGALAGEGRSPPEGTGPAIWQFFQDHPYKTEPSPYAASLPAGFLDYCSL